MELEFNEFIRVKDVTPFLKVIDTILADYAYDPKSSFTFYEDGSFQIRDNFYCYIILCL